MPGRGLPLLSKRLIFQGARQASRFACAPYDGLRSVSMGRNSAKSSAALRYGNMLPKRAVTSMSSGVARSGQISSRTVKAMEKWGKQRWPHHPARVFDCDGSKYSANVPHRVDGMGRAAKVWHFRRCQRNRWRALCRNRTILAGPSPPSTRITRLSS